MLHIESSCALQKQRIFWKDVKKMHQRKDNKQRDIKNHQEAERDPLMTSGDRWQKSPSN